MPIVQRLINPTEEEVDHLGDLLTRAFAGDRTVLVFVGGDQTLFAEFQRAFVRASCLEGETYVVIDEETNEVVTIASWFAPGRQLFDSFVQFVHKVTQWKALTLFVRVSPAQRALGFNELYGKLSKETSYWHEVTYPAEIAKLEKDFYTEDERSRRWWCFGLATDPKHRRKGYATAALLDFRQKLKDIDPQISTGLSVSVKENVAFYQKVGFELVIYRTIPAPVGSGDDLPLWLMGHNKPLRQT